MSEEQYHRILKSTTVIGGSSAINVVFRIVQSKAAALLIGPAGVGLMGLFNSVLSTASTITGMGLGTSGVREIAMANSSGDKEHISTTVTTFRYLAFGLGLVGSLVLFLLRQPISQLTFGNDQQAKAIGFLSIALFLNIIYSAHSTLLRGMSHIRELAKINIYGGALGTLVGLPILYVWRQNGIIAFIIGGYITSIIFSAWYAGKISIEKIHLSLKIFWSESHGFLSLGAGFMLASLASMASPYLIKLMVTRQLGLQATGLVEASSQIASIYVGFILGAMGTDFFPHLSAIAQDREKASHLINDQVKIGLYLAAPGILVVFALGPILINILYSSQFSGAYDVLRWQSLGTFLRVISWPLGFLILAKGQIKQLLFLEFSTNLIYLGSAWLGITLWGINGIGIAFLVMYIYHVCLTTIFARKLIDFHWSKSNLQLMGFLLLITLTAFGNSFFVPKLWAVVVGLIMTICMGVFSLKSIRDLVGAEAVTALLLRMRNIFHFKKKK
ncbi:MAG: O-antigen translocase [Anaerolineaceae bacterium]